MPDIRNVYGIGTKKANDLRKYYNIKTVDALRKYAKKIPGIVTDTQRLSLKYHNKVKTYITYNETTKHVNFIKKILPNAIIAGSYRREAKWIGDIDVLVTSDLKQVVSKLDKKRYIVASLGLGNKKFSGIVKHPRGGYRRIDIIKTTREEKPFALLYFTGDFVQNITMRQKAKRKKYTLSQYGLLNNKTNRMVKGLKSEKDIFNFLRIPYKEPKDRSHKPRERAMSRRSK